MAGLDGQFKSGMLEGFRGFKLIPLEVTWTAGTPAVSKNPMNESVTLTDVGAGDLTITLANAAVSPLIVAGMEVVSDANTLGLVANIDGAPTSTVIRVVVNSAADGTTETDPVAIQMLILKQVEFS